MLGPESSGAVPSRGIDEPRPPLSPEELLRNVPFFRGLDRVSIARLAGALEEVRVPAGRAIVREGVEADGLYLLESGQVSVQIRSEKDLEVDTLAAPAYFGELGLLLARRTATVRARTPACLWRLPKDRFVALVRDRPEIGLAVATSLAARFERQQRAAMGAPAAAVEPRPLVLDRAEPTRPARWRIALTLAALTLPLVLWNVAPPEGLDARAWRVLVLLLAAAVGWLAEAVPDFVVALALAVAWGATG